MTKAAQTLTKGERRLLFWVGAFIALVLGWLWWWTDINAIPAITYPARVMPSPNARDYFMRAVNMVQERENVTLGFRTIFRSRLIKHPLPEADIARVIRLNEPALAEFRQGFAYQYGTPDVKSFTDAETNPYAEDLRLMQRLMSMKAQYAADHGDWPSYAETSIDLLEMSVICVRQGGLYDAAVGDYFESIFQLHFRKQMPAIPPAIAKKILNRYESILAKRSSWAETIEEEKWPGLKYTIESMNSPDWRPSLLELKRVNDFTFDRKYYVHCLFRRKRDVVWQYLTAIDELIRDAKKPYALRSQHRRPITEELEVSSLSLACNGERFDTVNKETQTALLLCQLAIQTYHAEHRAYPPTLMALVPGYLSKLPNDPFAVSSTFGYDRIKSGYLLYSVGPNGKDDGGKASADGRPNAECRHPFLREESTGDIVAGVNVQ